MLFFVVFYFVFLMYSLSSQEINVTEPELELIRTNDLIKFAPPVRMCFLKFSRIRMRSSFNDDLLLEGKEE
jgi:hypothetical protein